MVVEDDDATREFLADNLTADSFGVVTASTGREAFNLLQMKELRPAAAGRDASGCVRLRALQAPALRGWPRAAAGSGPAGDPADRSLLGGGSRARFLARRGRLHREAVSLPGAGGADRRRPSACRTDAATEAFSRSVSCASIPSHARWSSTGRRIELSAKEFALLRTLAAEPTRVFTKEELLARRLGLQADGLDADARLAREQASAQAGGFRPQVDRERVGSRLPAHGSRRMSAEAMLMVALAVAVLCLASLAVSVQRALDWRARLRSLSEAAARGARRA